MAFSTVVLSCDKTYSVVEAPVGFSWTILFFGFLVPLVREDWIWFAIMFFLFLNFLLQNIPFYVVILYNLAAAFFYNKFFIKNLLKRGYKIIRIEQEEERVKAWLK